MYWQKCITIQVARSLCNICWILFSHSFNTKVYNLSTKKTLSSKIRPIMFFLCVFM